MSTRATNSNNYPSVSWADTLDVQWSALRWDVKRAMKSLCSKLEEIGEQCFVVTVNVSNGWVGHLGTVRGDEYIDEKSHILYDFLNYCAESLDYDNCKDGKTNSDLDTEVSDENKESEVEEDETPIRISRPGPAASDMKRSDSEDHVIVQTPVQYQRQKPKAKLIPSEIQLSNLVLLNPIGLPLVTQNVAMATNIPVGQLSAGKETDKTDISLKEGISNDQASGSKRKRKQSFDGIEKYSRDQKLAGNTLKMQRSKMQSEPNSKLRLSKGQRKKNDNHSNQADSEGTESAESENNSDVSESDRVLRSKSLHGYKTRRKLLPWKRREDGGNSDVDEENNWDDDYDNDDDDEDWSEEKVLRDKLGRFLPCESSSKKCKNKRKRQKASEFSASYDSTNEIEHNESIEETSIADGSEFDKEAGCVANVETDPNTGVANKKNTVKRDNECVSRDTKGTSQDTKQDDDKTYPNVKFKSRKRKGKMKSHEKRETKKGCVVSLSDSIDVQEGKDNKDVITEQTGKESVDI